MWFSRLLFIGVFGLGSAFGAFPAGWLRQAKLTIQHGQVPADQTAFPVLLTAATLPAEMVTTGDPNAAQTDGGDIRFSSDANGVSQMACQVVVWAENPNPALASAEIWVPVSVLTGSNVDIYVWYKAGGGATQPAAGAAFGSQAVWDANFLGVWHLANGTSLDPNDSTANGNNLTNNGAWGAGAAQIDGGTNKSNGTNQSLSNASIPSPASVTFSCWQKILTADVSTDALFFMGTQSSKMELHAPFSDNNLYWDYGNSTAGNGRISASYVPYLNTFTHVAVIYNSSNGLHAAYANGALLVSNTHSVANPAVTGVTINHFNSFPDPFGKRIVDELRLSNIARSATWITTEYNNQLAPASFVVAGPGGPAPNLPADVAGPRALIGVGK